MKVNDIWALTAAGELGELDEPAMAAERSPLLDVKVMMVDDEPLMTDLIQTYLEDEGYANFVVTNDPRDAIELLRREAPGVLLLDLMMPAISGFDLLEALRADRKLRYTPVIVLTAATGADAKLRALRLGASDFLSKPVDPSELVLRVRNTLAFNQYHSRLVNFDPVTGLPNAALFVAGIDAMLERRSPAGGLVALFSIEVPSCRQLREAADQATADGLAKVLTRRLDRFAGEATPPHVLAASSERAPRVARLGADQFALLLEGMADPEAVELAARKLIRSLSEVVRLGLHELAPTVWMGIALAPTDGDSGAALRKSADLAASHARQQATAPFKFASAELHARSLEKLTLGSQLRGAAERGELCLHYQPKVDVVSGRIVGAEALVRWNHPQRGLIAPLHFIPLAEELGLITGIGQWVLEQTCSDAAAWAQAGLGEIKVAINVAKPQFAAGDFCGALRQALFDSGVPARQLIVELTESMLMDDVESALAQMHAMKALGVTLSIDDFGTGYSSLSYLKRFPIDELKIDRSFVVDLPGRQADLAIVRAVVDLGHNLGLAVTAEGVELPEQLACLQQLGCDTYQGYLFSRPLPEPDFVALLAQTRL